MKKALGIFRQCGKTHVASCIANDYLFNRKARVIYANWSNLAQDIRIAYRIINQRYIRNVTTIITSELTIDDIGEPIDDIGEALDNIAKAIGGMGDEESKDNAEKDHPSPSDLIAAIVGKRL